jgi:hypothetical protein
MSTNPQGLIVRSEPERQFLCGDQAIHASLTNNDGVPYIFWQ